MSQYLNVFLKRKEDNKGIKVDLFWLCTTHARHLDSIGAFPYTEEDVLLEEDDFKVYINCIKKEINDCKKYLDKYNSDLKEAKDRLPLAQNKEIYNEIKEEINAYKSYISDLEETINEYEGYINELSYAWKIYQDNIDGWDLYYNNR